MDNHERGNQIFERILSNLLHSKEPIEHSLYTKSQRVRSDGAI